MIRRFVTVIGTACLAATMLQADFSYKETSTVTGGTMLSLMKVAGVFSKSANEPKAATVAVKGDRMVRRSEDDATVIDLNAQTITNINFQKKNYSVMTFEQMKQALEAAQQKAGKSGAKMEFKVSVDNTGKTQQIAGLEAKEMILKMEMQAADNKGNSGSMMITEDMWIASGVAGYAEVRDFYNRMAAKLDWTPSGNMFMSNPDVSKGMASAAKEMAKLEGVPVLQIITMGAPGQPGAPAPSAAPAAAPAPQEQPQAQQPAAGGSLGGALGRLGGLGGLGRKSAPKQESAPSASSAAPTAPGALIEMKTEMSAFSTASVDDAQFQPPAGFKKVDADLKNMK
jgi:hypothetical protein